MKPLLLASLLLLSGCAPKQKCYESIPITLYISEDGRDPQPSDYYAISKIPCKNLRSMIDEARE